ncbi:MAG: aminotransferase class V-fold PLP-dependent enzyme [Proteobacteria bacterium]|nr:aminotransferase class V-fold PLP-dependent enzyme [Pseudomonadota bacterium]
MPGDLIYLDNAATTYPKPRPVLDRMIDIYGRQGVSPGRGSYDLAVEAEELAGAARSKLARFFKCPDPDRVIFAGNATDALNLVIQGLIRPGDHVVSTRLEHNSVLRPLYHLRQQGRIDYDLASFDGQGFIDPAEIGRLIRADTRMVIVNHASNVLGTVQPVAEIGRVCADRGVPLIIDAAQSAGVIPIDMSAWQVGAVAFTGHKSLFGPSGIGGLAVSPELEIQITRFGGTGIDSHSLTHTPTFPHRLEAGTLNLLGVIGLSLGLDFLEAEGIEVIHRREMELLARLRDGLAGLPGIRLYGVEDLSRHVGLMMVNVEGIDPEDVGAILDADFDIAVRVGLHCAPLVHESLGTAPRGGVRFSLGPFNRVEEIDRTIAAMRLIAESGKRSGKPR